MNILKQTYIYLIIYSNTNLIKKLKYKTYLFLFINKIINKTSIFHLLIDI